MRDKKGYRLDDIYDSYTVIDIETTGLDPSKDKIIEVAAIRVKEGSVTDTYSSLINPESLIPDFIVELTGITNEMLTTAPDLITVMTAFRDFIGDDVLLGHNVSFDINFLYDNFVACFGEPLENNYIDTLPISRKLYLQLTSHKLSVLTDYHKIEHSSFHRALNDCEMTHKLYAIMKEDFGKPSAVEREMLDSLNIENNPFQNSRIVVKGTPKLYSYAFMRALAEKHGTKLSNIFYSSSKYIILAGIMKKRYLSGENSGLLDHVNHLKEQGLIEILFEEDFYNQLNIPIPEQKRSSSDSAKLSAKDIVANTDDFDETHPIYDKTFVFTGTLEKMPRREAMQIVVDHGGKCGDNVTAKTNYLVLGNNDYCPLIKDGKSTKQKKAESMKLSGADIEIISENVFYDMIEE